MPTINADALAIATQYINSEIPALFVYNSPLLSLLTKNKKKVPGGNNYQMPLNNYKNNATGFIPNSGAVTSVNQNQELIYGTLNWKYFYYSINVSLEDITITHDAPEAIADLIMLRASIAKETAVQTIQQAVWQGTTSDTNQFNGIADIFAASGTSYAGLSNTTYSDWFYQTDTSSTAQYRSVVSLLNKVKTRSRDSIFPEVNTELGLRYNPDMIITNPFLQSNFLAANQNQRLYTDSAALDSGFDGAVSVNGVKWYSDYYCPGTADGVTADNHLYILSSASLFMWQKYWFGDKTPVDYNGPIPNQPNTVHTQYLAGNMACINRRVNGVNKVMVS